MLRNKKGFTLVELLAVIVILALLIVVTANTILPMMNKTKKTAMITYAEKVLRNAETMVQTDTLFNSNQEVFFYKITELMGQTDYYGCVMVTTRTNPSKYDYHIKMFSYSESYHINAVSTNLIGKISPFDSIAFYSDEFIKIGDEDISIVGTINPNGTISDINLDYMEIKLPESKQWIVDVENTLSNEKINQIERFCGNPNETDEKVKLNQFKGGVVRTRLYKNI